MTELMSEFGRFLSLAQQWTIPHDIANDLLVRFTSGMDGLLGVAGGCWDDEITNVMTWNIMDHSLKFPAKPKHQ